MLPSGISTFGDAQRAPSYKSLSNTTTSVPTDLLSFLGAAVAHTKR